LRELKRDGGWGKKFSLLLGSNIDLKENIEENSNPIVK
jgi:hypothetical protein